MTTPPYTSPVKRLFSEAAVLAALPLLGYFYAFLYEWGYLSHYGLPAWLIDVRASQVALIVVLLIIAASTIWTFLRTIPSAPYWGVLNHLFFLAIPVGAIALAITFTDWTSPGEVFFAVTATLSLGVLSVGEFVRLLIRPLFIYHGTILERWAHEAMIDAKKDSGDVANSIAEALQHKGVPFAHYFLITWLTLFVLPYGNYFSARFVAAHQVTYLVRLDSPQCIVLRKYAEEYICAQLGGDRTSVIPRFTMFGAEARTTLERKVLGRLAIRRPLAIRSQVPDN